MCEVLRAVRDARGRSFGERKVLAQAVLAQKANRQKSFTATDRNLNCGVLLSRAAGNGYC